VAYHRRLAGGGTGVIVSESMRVHASNRGRNESLVLYLPETIPSLAKVAEAVHAEGALFVAQLNHGGRQHHSNEHPTLWAPSAIACPHSGGIPHAMTQRDIRDVVAGFAKAAGHAKEAGCAGIEIHGAQGHLIQEFISPFSNVRTDEYGGSMKNRVRFAVEIVQAIRDKVGADMTLGYRMGVHEFWAGALDVEQSKEAAILLDELGMIDYFSLAQGNFNTLDYHLPDAHFAPVPFIDLQSQFKPVLKAPVAASGRITMPEQAERIIAGGQADMVGMSRALVADPEWPVKAQAGQVEQIRQCIGCMKCWVWVTEAKPLRCAINPTVGQELVPFPVANVRKKVLVIGGGPAGLEAARASATAGHDVILYERSAFLGGKLFWAKGHQPYNESSIALNYLIGQVHDLGVDVRMATEPTAAMVAAERPDAVIVATGATPQLPDLPNDGSVPMATMGALKHPARVVVMDEDGYFWGATTTEFLARQGCQVTYVTRFLEPFRELAEVTRISTLREVDKLGVRLLPNMFVDRCESGGVVLRHYYNTSREERIDAVDTLVWIGRQMANDGIAAELEVAGVSRVYVVGDALAPRRLHNAIQEGYQAAASLTAAA
jgi:2,4-dienoyl-CoA reductase-like NADH-dependent reductase (Old Yellow Enzyme family)